MTEKELFAIRNKPQNITNILDSLFEFKWDWLDYSIGKGETQSHAFYLAEHGAFHMARKYCLVNKKDFHKEGWKIVDEIMSKVYVDYNKLTKPQAQELAKKRKISILDDNDNEKTKTVLVAELKASH